MFSRRYRDAEGVEGVECGNECAHQHLGEGFGKGTLCPCPDLKMLLKLLIILNLCGLVDFLVNGSYSPLLVFCAVD